MLEDLMGAYQATGNVPKTLDAAKRLLQVEPNNLRALTVVVYLEHLQANGNQAMLDDAAAVAQQGLNATKDTCMTQADYDKLKDTATPVFYGAIAADDTAKKDFKGEIDAYTKELQSYKDPTQTTQVPALLDTYYLGNAYLQLDPKDLKNADLVPHPRRAVRQAALPSANRSRRRILVQEVPLRPERHRLQRHSSAGIL